MRHLFVYAQKYFLYDVDIGISCHAHSHAYQEISLAVCACVSGCFVHDSIPSVQGGIDCDSGGRVCGTLVVAFQKDASDESQKNVVSVAFALIMGGVLMSGSYWFSHLDDLGARDASGIRSNASFYERQTLWTTTFRMVQEKPLAGCGAGNWKVSHPSASVRDIFSVDILDFNFVRPHNEYLKVISELGIIGLVLMMLIISSFFVDAFWGAVGRNRIIVSVGSSVIGGLCTFAVFDFPFDRMETLCWTMLIAGCVCARRAHPAKRVDAYFIKGSITIALFCDCLLGCGRWYSEKCVKSILGYVHRGVWNKVEMLSREAYMP